MSRKIIPKYNQTLHSIHFFNCVCYLILTLKKHLCVDSFAYISGFGLFTMSENLNVPYSKKLERDISSVRTKVMAIFSHTFCFQDIITFVRRKYSPMWLSFTNPRQSLWVCSKELKKPPNVADNIHIKMGKFVQFLPKNISDTWVHKKVECI